MGPLLLCRFAQTSVAVLLSGTAVLRLLAWGTEVPGAVRRDRLAWGCLGALLVTGGLQLVLTAAEMSGQPFGQACSGETLRSVLDETHFGAVWKVRVALLLGLCGAEWLRLATRRRDPRPGVSAALEITGALWCGALLASLVWSGHAHASDKHGWLLPVNALHALAAGAWPGGLLPLALLLGDARRDPVLVPTAMTVTRRFSSLSAAAVGTLAFSGLLNGVGLVGTLSALWSSPYGRLLLCKGVLLAGMVGLGAMNRRLLRPQAAGDAVRTLRRLWRNVAVECVLATCVLLATEALATSPPPA